MLVVFLFLFTVFMILIAFPVMVLAPRSALMNALMRFWGQGIVWSTRSDVVVKGLENIDPKKSYLYLSNHQSQFDILLLYALIPGRYRMVAKKELFKVPFIGWAMILLGFIKIDRSNREAAVKSLDLAAARMKQEKLSVLIYPEGTRSVTGELLPFKKGPFHLAIAAGHPVVPIIISGSNRVHNKHRLFKIYSKQKVHVHIGTPVDITSLSSSDRSELMVKFQKIMQEMFEPIKSHSL